MGTEIESGGNGLFAPIASSDEEKGKTESLIEVIPPYSVECTVKGASAILFHAWDVSDIDDRSKAAKGSKKKKTDNVEAYVYRCPDRTLGIPAANIKATIVNAARWTQDPRSPRKSAMDLFKAGIFITPPIASFGKPTWDYLDKRRVTVQRNGITRVRPALLEGWKVSFTVTVLQPEYISDVLLNEVLARAGSLVGFCDFRPEYGRFQVVRFEVLK